jgi:hypothetical protein
MMRHIYEVVNNRTQFQMLDGSAEPEKCRAAGLGIEPRLEASKAPVLPLDDPAMFP